MKNNQKLIAAVALLLIAAFRLITWCSPKGISESAEKSEEALGMTAVEMLAEELPAGAEVLVLIQAEGGGRLTVLEDAVKQAIKERGLQLGGMARIPAGSITTHTGLSEAAFQQALSEAPDAAGFLSFAGLPPLRAIKQGAPTMKGVVAFPNPDILPQYFQSGWVSKAIQPNPVAPQKAPKASAGMDIWFNAYFVKVFASSPGMNAGNLPADPSGLPADHDQP